MRNFLIMLIPFLLALIWVIVFNIFHKEYDKHHHKNDGGLW
jgi:hypothetical protein